MSSRHRERTSSQRRRVSAGSSRSGTSPLLPGASKRRGERSAMASVTRRNQPLAVTSGSPSGLSTFLCMLGKRELFGADEVTRHLDHRPPALGRTTIEQVGIDVLEALEELTALLFESLQPA